MVRPTLVLRATEWSSTLYLPKSSLPHRALASARPTYIRKCANDLYSWQATNRPATNTFTLADGPPYANGDVHVGHALNKILKDILCRFQLSTGKRVQYVPGWDCHGLPIEVKALQTMDTEDRADPKKIRVAARELATRTIELQKTAFRDWGVMGDWDNAYLTMEHKFELRQLEVFKMMVAKGLIYRQYKPVQWSPSSRTALAEAELEYDENHVSHAAFVKFRIVTAPSTIPIDVAQNKVFALIWTTTPWTLPANRAIAFHEDVEYCIIEDRRSGEYLLVASALVREVLHYAGLEDADVHILDPRIKGRHMVGVQYINPLRGKLGKLQPMVHGWFVNTNSGSGLVHMAPGHGQDDFELCHKLGIESIAPVDDAGCFTSDALPDQPEMLTGKPVLEEGNKAVLELLKNQRDGNLVWATHRYKHKYPVDWRTKLPLIVRATAQWFAKVDSIKSDALQALDAVQFIPASSKARLQSFVTGRNEWCISRQRAWGLPIPALYRENGRASEAILTPDSVQHIIDVIKQRGTDAWWTDETDDPAWISPTLASGKYVRGRDTMDVWFDSGTTWTSLEQVQPGKPAADIYLEGSDQHRGWFQSSLLTYVACQDSKTTGLVAAPYKTLITHGFTLDAKSRKMSKSLGNVISPKEIIDGTLLPLPKRKKGQPATLKSAHDAMGPDALRLWAASNDYTTDIAIGTQLLNSIHQSLHKFRVTFRWLLGNLSDYEPSPRYENVKDATPRHLMDKIALYQLKKVNHQAFAAYMTNEPFKALVAINKYVNTDLSAFYFEAAKDIIYAGEQYERLRVQTACFDILQGLMQMLAPVLPILVTEVVDHSPPQLKEYFSTDEHDPLKRVWSPVAPESVLNHEAETDAPVEARMQLIQSSLAAVRAAQEKARVQKRLGSGLDCDVELVLSQDGTPEWITHFFQEIMKTGELEEALVVSKVDLSFSPNDLVAADSKQTAFEHSVSLSDFLGTSFGAQNATITARILPPSESKCARCWKYTVPDNAADSQTHSDHGASSETEGGGKSRLDRAGDVICQRCESVMTKRQEQRALDPN